MIWSEQLTTITFTGCDKLKVMQLRCPALSECNHPPLIQAQGPTRPAHPPLHDLIKSSYKKMMQAENDRRAKENALINSSMQV